MAQNAANSVAQIEHNKKWRCYILICVASLTNFVSLSQAVDVSVHFRGASPIQYIFGIATFTTSLIVLLVDLVGFVRNKLDFKSLKEGKVEGSMLFVFVLWWVCGVVSMTRAGAVAYAAMNIYLSAWASLFSCLYALDAWGGEKEILTLRQLTSISITLSSWWIVFWASVVTVGSAADAMKLATTPFIVESCGIAVGMGMITAIISAFFVLSHYEFLQCCQACNSWLSYGGWFELVCSLFVNAWLIVGLDQLTGAGRIASTVNGNSNIDSTSTDYVPGTNIYVAVWTAFVASARVTVKWKEARAIRFAQTSGGGGIGSETETEESNDGSIEECDV